MIKRWIPWNFIIKRAAKAYGIMDPLTFLARLRRFAQPSEVQEPIDLLRAGSIFHARGLINTKAISTGSGRIGSKNSSIPAMSPLSPGPFPSATSISPTATGPGSGGRTLPCIPSSIPVVW